MLIGNIPVAAWPFLLKLSHRKFLSSDMLPQCLFFSFWFRVKGQFVANLSKLELHIWHSKPIGENILPESLGIHPYCKRLELYEIAAGWNEVPPQGVCSGSHVPVWNLRAHIFSHYPYCCLVKSFGEGWLVKSSNICTALWYSCGFFALHWSTVPVFRIQVFLDTRWISTSLFRLKASPSKLSLKVDLQKHKVAAAPKPFNGREDPATLPND